MTVPDKMVGAGDSNKEIETKEGSGRTSSGVFRDSLLSGLSFGKTRRSQTPDYHL